MADGFTDLEEKIMAVLVKERKTAANVIADVHEIAGFLELSKGDEMSESMESVWKMACREAEAERDKLRTEYEVELRRLNLQISEKDALLAKAVRLLSVCSFDHPMDLEDLDEVNDYVDKQV